MQAVYGTNVTNFNSIKVRLRHTIQLKSNNFSLHFNSIKVRLRRYKGWCAKTVVPQFQFHKGSIKTPRYIQRLCLWLYFNSIKVRLRPTQNPPSAVPHLFQFHKGSIKTFLCCLCWETVNLFQFHKGSIKTITNLNSHLH